MTATGRRIIRPASRKLAFDIGVFSFRELEHYPVGRHEALVLVIDEERWPSRVPDGFSRELRLRISPGDLRDRTPATYESLFLQGRYALNFARLHGPSCNRLAISSPEGEVRGPGLAAGLLSALDFPLRQVTELATAYPKLSTTVRDSVLEAAGKLPPTPLEKAAHSPLTKAALLLLAKLTEGRFHS